MTFDDACNELLELLSSYDECIISWQEARRWPRGALEHFLEVGWLHPTHTAKEMVCHGCTEHCFMPVHFPQSGKTPSSKPFIACDLRSDMGRIPVEMKELQRWILKRQSFANWLSTKLKLIGKPAVLGTDNAICLGKALGTNGLIPIFLHFRETAKIEVSGHELLISELLSSYGEMLTLDQDTLLAMTRWPKKEKTPFSKTKTSQVKLSDFEVGTPEWRSELGRKAAIAKHGQPGGSWEKQETIRNIWEKGIYKTKDECAEQECAELGMSFSSARKALRNLPKPIDN